MTRSYCAIAPQSRLAHMAGAKNARSMLFNMPPLDDAVRMRIMKYMRTKSRAPKTKRQHDAIAIRKCDAAAKRLEEAMMLISDAIHHIHECSGDVGHVQDVYGKLQSQINSLKGA